MKIIFLDIDGVLNTADTVVKVDSAVDIDLFRVEYLKRIVDKTDAKIVLTSSNKVHFKKENGRVVPVTDTNCYGHSFINILMNYGLELYDVIPTIRNSLGREASRQEEIKVWLSLNNNVDGFVILDDETTGLMDFIGLNFIILNNLPIGETLCNMDNCVGLGEEHIELAVNILNNRTRNKVYKKTKGSN